jgi:hypothetical protein
MKKYQALRLKEYESQTTIVRRKVFRLGKTAGHGLARLSSWLARPVWNFLDWLYVMTCFALFVAFECIVVYWLFTICVVL